MNWIEAGFEFYCGKFLFGLTVAIIIFIIAGICAGVSILMDKNK